MLVGMLKNPALFNPNRASRLDTVMQRRMVVLDQMRKNGFLTTAQYDSLKALPLGLRFQRVDHTEGPAPYFREVLRSKLQALLETKNDDGTYKYAKADGSPYDIYTDGLKIYTTLDKDMQQYGEYAVREHLGQELQPDFFQDLAKKKNRPFDFRVSQEEIDGILNTPTWGLPIRAEAVVDGRNLFDFQSGVHNEEGFLRINGQGRTVRGGILVRF